MEEKTMEIEVLIDFSEYLQCHYLMFRKKLHRIFILLGIIFLASIFIILIKFGLNSDALKISFILLASILLFIGLLFLSLYFVIKKTFDSTPVLKQKVTYRLTESEIEANGDSFNTKCGWDVIIKVEEFTSYFLLYSSTAAAFIFPLRRFENDSQIVEFRELVRRKLGDKAKLNS
jgi:predicted ferric reductase